MHRAVIHMPSWFPGAGFKHTARKWRPIVDNALQTTYDKVKGDLVSFSRCLLACSSGFAVPTEKMCGSTLRMLGFRNGRPIRFCKYDIKTW
jgi:hypothetical protein